MQLITKFTEEKFLKTNNRIINKFDKKLKSAQMILKEILFPSNDRILTKLSLATSKSLRYRSGYADECIASAVELINGCLLLHTRIMEPQINNNTEQLTGLMNVLFGDYILTKAFDFLVDTKSIEVLKIISTASYSVTSGYVRELSIRKKLETPLDIYLTSLDERSGALFSSACQSAAVISNAGKKEFKAFEKYGFNLGVAYQIINDSYIYFNSKKLNFDQLYNYKSKICLPILLSYQTSNASEKEFWDQMINNSYLNKKNYNKSLDIIQKHESIYATSQIVKKYLDRAVESLFELDDDIEVDCFIDLANYIYNKNFNLSKNINFDK